MKKDIETLISQWIDEEQCDTSLERRQYKDGAIRMYEYMCQEIVDTHLSGVTAGEIIGRCVTNSWWSKAWNNFKNSRDIDEQQKNWQILTDKADKINK